MSAPTVAADYVESTVLADVPTLDGERLVVSDLRHVDSDGVNHEYGLQVFTPGGAQELVALSPATAAQLATALGGCVR